MAMAQLQKQLGRAPTMAEVGKEVDMPADRVAEILAAARPSSSLEVAAVGGEDDGAAEAKDQLAVRLRRRAVRLRASTCVAGRRAWWSRLAHAHVAQLPAPACVECRTTARSRTR